LMVVRHGKTTRYQVAGAVDRLEYVGAPLICTIINMTPVGKRRSTYGYGSGSGYRYESDVGGAEADGALRMVRNLRYASAQSARVDSPGDPPAAGTTGQHESTGQPVPTGRPPRLERQLRANESTGFGPSASPWQVSQDRRRQTPPDESAPEPPAPDEQSAD